MAGDSPFRSRSIRQSPGHWHVYSGARNGNHESWRIVSQRAAIPDFDRPLDSRVLHDQAPGAKGTFDVIVRVSVGWLSQIFFGPSPGKSSRIVLSLVPSFVKPPGEDVFDPMNSHGNIRRRQTRDLADRCRIHVVEIRDDDLAIERFETLNQAREPVQIQAPVRSKRTLDSV